jgi:hypothetical protein
MWASSLTILKYCSAIDVSFNVTALAALPYAEAGSWDWISSATVDGTEVDFDGLFGNSQSSYGEEGYLWYGTELHVEFMTSVPVVAWVMMPSPLTLEEEMTAYYDDESAQDFLMGAYPDFDIFMDFEEVFTQTVTIQTYGEPADRFMHKIGVISACNSLDESNFHFVDIGESCEYMSGNEEINCGYDEYDLAEHEGIFYIQLPAWELEAQDLSSASCFEARITLWNDDGTDYTGPLYVNEWNELTLDEPYEWVGETLSGRVEITLQQPISDYVFTLPILNGSVEIIDSDAPEDPYTCDENWARCAEVYSTYGEVDGSIDDMFDGDLSTTYSAICETSTDGLYYAEIHVTFNETIPLQTVAIKTDLGDTGHIFRIDENGDEEYCVTDDYLDGYHKCAAWTDNLTIRKNCDSTIESSFNVVALAAITYAEAGSWDWITAVYADESEV